MTLSKPLRKNQRLVLNALHESTGPLTAYDLLDRLREDGVKAPATVYRALEGLLEAGLAHRIESMNAFVACGSAHEQGMVALAICRDCGEVTEFSDAKVAKRLELWAVQAGFRIGHTTLELSGHCGRCRA